MNIKDSYLHGGTKIVKNVGFSIASSGTYNGKLVATITWAKEGESDTLVQIPLNGASFGSLSLYYVLAAPTTGAGNPSFRALTADDIRSGTLASDRLPLATNSAKGAILLAVALQSSAITINNANRNYGLGMTTTGQGYVNVPWTDKTGIKLATVSGTKKTDSTVIIDNSSTGLSILGGTNLFKIGDGTNYIEVPISTSSTSHNHDTVYTKKTLAIPYIVGPSTDTTAGTWTGTYADITAYEEGLTIIYVPAVAGASTTSLNINGLGAVLCFWTNTNGMTTHFTVGTPIMFTYRTIGSTAGWRRADYNSDTLPCAMCWTGAADGVKTASCSNYGLSANSYIIVDIANANTKADALTLNINGQGAKPIYINGTASSSSNYTLPRSTYLVYYDGTNYYFRTDGKITTAGLVNTSNNSLLVNTTYKLTLNGTVKGTTGGTDLGTFYAVATSDASAANQVWMRNADNNAYIWRTLGSRAFDSTAYLPLSGGTMTGNITFSAPASAGLKRGFTFNGVADKGSLFYMEPTLSDDGRFRFLLEDNNNDPVEMAWRVYNVLDENDLTYELVAHLFNLTEYIALGGIASPGGTSSYTFRPKTNNYGSIGNSSYKWNSIYATTLYGNLAWSYLTGIPTNSSSAAGIVPKGVASSVYMTNSSGVPAWTTIDTTVTQSSSNLVTSGAVFTAIANGVAGGVQYLGSVAQASDVTGKSAAGYGDFVRVTTLFTINNVTAHVGDIIFLNSNDANAYQTASNWIVAHTEIDTNTWTAASTSAAGYIPKLVTGGTALASSSNDYVLSFVNGTDTTPVWKKLPATAYSAVNNATYSIKSKIGSTATTISDFTANLSTADDFTLILGTAIAFTNDTTNRTLTIGAVAWTGATENANGTSGYMPGATSGLRYLFLRGDGTWCSLNNYSLPKATTSALGGVIVSNVLTTAVTLTSADGATANRYYGVQLDKDGKAFVNIPWVWTAWAGATESAAGTAGYMPAATSALRNQFLRGDGTWCSLNNYSLPKATTSALGGVIVSNVLTTAVTLTSANGSTASRYYGVLLDKDGKAFVNIPWTDTKVSLATKSDSVSYYLVFKNGTTAQAETLYFNSNITVNPSTKTITATTFAGALSGNASTASNIASTSRGYWYQSANNTTTATGVGSINAVSKIGIPYIGHNGSANTYGLYEDLFYLSSTTKYIGDTVKSTKFVNTKTKNSTTDDWTGSGTAASGTSSASTFTAGDGISINNGLISTTRKEWYGTEALFNAISSLDANTTYYITES